VAKRSPRFLRLCDKSVDARDMEITRPKYFRDGFIWFVVFSRDYRGIRDDSRMRKGFVMVCEMMAMVYLVGDGGTR
jgi:hypothetical protein